MTKNIRRSQPKFKRGLATRLQLIENGLRNQSLVTYLRDREEAHKKMLKAAGDGDIPLHVQQEDDDVTFKSVAQKNMQAEQ